MPIQIIIGRNGNQPFQLNDPKVSGRHAVLTMHEGGQLQLMDTNSTNGTFIYDGREFKRIPPHQIYNVTPESMIQLGPDTRFHVRRLLPAQRGVQGGGAQRQGQPQSGGAQRQGQQQGGGQQAAQTPKRRDISHLRRISDKYTETRMALETKASSINGLRSLTIVASLAAGTGSFALSDALGYEDNKLMSGLISVLLAVTIIAILLSIINKRSKKLLRDRNDNEHEYAVKYCCPECNLSFRGKVYENILSERQCPRCKTEFYEVPRRN